MELLRHAPKGVFKSRNLMTQEVIGYVQCTVYGQPAWAELSTGLGLRRQPIFGVTFRRLDGRAIWEETGSVLTDPSGCFPTQGQAEGHIRKYMDAPEASE